MKNKSLLIITQVLMSILVVLGTSWVISVSTTEPLLAYPIVAVWMGVMAAMLITLFGTYTQTALAGGMIGVGLYIFTTISFSANMITLGLASTAVGLIIGGCALRLADKLRRHDDIHEGSSKMKVLAQITFFMMLQALIVAASLHYLPAIRAATAKAAEAAL
jgi:hypothetical protein